MCESAIWSRGRSREGREGESWERLERSPGRHAPCGSAGGRGPCSTESICARDIHEIIAGIVPTNWNLQLPTRNWNVETPAPSKLNFWPELLLAAAPRGCCGRGQAQLLLQQGPLTVTLR